MASGTTGHLNRLVASKSPYLRQHASNPVDWYPFDNEALDKAKRENKVLIYSYDALLIYLGHFSIDWL